MSDTTSKDDELRQEMEDISCEYGRPHEDTCDLNSEEGAIDGCTCSVGHLLDELLPLIKQYGIQERIDGHREGYGMGVYDFRNYFMDASIPAQRMPIGMEIAEELVKDYKYPYKTNIRLTALKDKENE